MISGEVMPRAYIWGPLAIGTDIPSNNDPARPLRQAYDFDDVADSEGRRRP